MAGAGCSWTVGQATGLARACSGATAGRLEVDKIVPLAASPQRRVMPLQKLELRSGFNQSLALTSWSTSCRCRVQKVDAAARHLERARNAMQSLPADEGAR